MTFEFTHSPPQTLNEPLARIEAQTQSALDSVEKTRDFSAQLNRLRGRGSVAGVSVVVDHVGLTREVVFTDPATRMSPEALSSATMGAVRAALSDALEQVAARAHETFGSDGMAAHIVAEVSARFAVVSR